MDKYLKRPNTDNPKRSGKVKKHNEYYIVFGFLENSVGKLMRNMFLQVLSNEAMKPAKLKLHLITRQPEYSVSGNYLSGPAKNISTNDQNSLICPQRLRGHRRLPFQWLLQNARSFLQLHKNWSSVAAVGMCEIMLGTEAANKLKSIPLSDDTVKRRIDDLSDDILSQLLGRLRCSEVQFSIQ